MWCCKSVSHQPTNQRLTLSGLSYPTALLPSRRWGTSTLPAATRVSRHITSPRIGKPQLTPRAHRMVRPPILDLESQHAAPDRL